MIKEELQQQANELIDKLRPLRDKISTIEEKEKRNRLKKLIGKCFIYKNNCYSCPESDKDYWDVYYRVLGITGGNSLDCLTFQTEKYGFIEIERRPVSESMWEEKLKRNPITEREFEKKLKKVWNKIKEVKQ